MKASLAEHWTQMVNSFVWTRAGRMAAKFWHRLMPSFPVKRRIFNLEVYFDSRDHPFVWYSNRRKLEENDNLAVTLKDFHGLIWDVGANAGLYSLWMAAQGNQVIAFDISPKSISYILKSAEHNGLKNITGVPRAFSVEAVRYQPPQSAIAGNKLGGDGKGGEVTAITYQEAARQFGIPVLIKMDIEGHEEAFLRSTEFKEWLIQNKITLVMELHREEFWDLLWKDMKTTRLYSNQVLIQANEVQTQHRDLVSK